MSRADYSEDYGDDPLAVGRWRAAVRRATRGKRGQALLREMRDALDAMPVKELVAETLANDQGECCAMGAAALTRVKDGRVSIDQVLEVDPEDSDQVARLMNAAPALVREIAYHNDEVFPWRAGDSGETDEQCRWRQMRAWVASQIFEGADRE